MTKKTRRRRRTTFASFATASFEEVERTEGVEGQREARRAPLPPPAGHEVRLEAVGAKRGGRDLAAVLEADRVRWGENGPSSVKRYI